jgi:hypothetical protein
MKYLKTIAMLLGFVMATGCTTRSISNFGYRSDHAYRGELSELEVLGVRADAEVTEADIQKALTSRERIHLKNGDRLVLVQSGARFPDEVMMAEMKRYYSVVPLSGVPTDDEYRDHRSSAKRPLDKVLRLAAARAGAKTLIVCWGVLESERESYATKALSWVPIVGAAIPDESQNLRLRLKLIVIDVASGRWELLIPEEYADKRGSARIARKDQDQIQVRLLKDNGYRSAVRDLQVRYQ